MSSHRPHAAPARFLDTRGAEAARAFLPPGVLAWLRAEQQVSRRVDRRLLDPGTVDRVLPGYLPDAGNVFHLPSFVVPERAAHAWSAELPAGLAAHFFPRRGHLRVLHHPLGGELPYPRAIVDKETLFASPTSSTRTVLAWSSDVPPFLAKLSIPRVIAAEHRALDTATIAASVGRTRLLRAFDRRTLDFLEEPLGIAPRDRDTGGFLVRALPRNVLRGTRRLVPFFAWARGGDAAWFLHRFLPAYLAFSLAGGAAEAHSQNLLVETDARGRATGRFFLRDMEGISLDLDHLHAIGRLPADLPVARHLDDDHDTADHALAVQRGLHTFLLGGPMHLLRVPRAAFHQHVNRAIHDVDPRAPRIRDGESFHRWLTSARFNQRPRPSIPKPLRAWLHREQQVNDRVRHPRLFAPINLAALPAHLDPAHSPVFPLLALLVPAADVDLQPGKLDATWRRRLVVTRGGRTFVRVHVHPAALSEYAVDLAMYDVERGVHVATPTASPRSLVVWSAHGTPDPFVAKLSLDVELLRISRLVRTSKLARARLITGVLDAMGSVEHLREPVTLRLRDRGHGTIFRELPARTSDLVPGFSLLSRRSRRLDSVTLTTRVLEPVVRTATMLSFQHGLLPDLHAQNVLFRVDAHGIPTGELVVRDLDSFKTDEDLRRRRGLDMAPWRATGGTREDLKLDGTAAWYDEALLKQVRAEWAFLAHHHRDEEGRAWWRTMDRLLFAHAAAQLGLDLAVGEICHALVRSGRADRAQLASMFLGVTGARELAGALDLLPGDALMDRADPARARYSLNALVHAWRGRLSG